MHEEETFLKSYGNVSQKSSIFYETRSFIILFTKATIFFFASSSHKIPVHISHPIFFKIPVSFILASTPNRVSASDILTKILYAFPAYTKRSTCRTNLVLPALIIRIISGVEYKFWRSSLYNFIQSPVMFPSTDLTFSSTIRSQTSSTLYSSPNIGE
jgi:hypothetical protein